MSHLGKDSSHEVNSDEFSRDLGQPTTSTSRITRNSTIVYTLSETLRDSTALSYFIQFLEEIGQLNLIKFWLHIENFRTSAFSIRPEDHTLIEALKNDASNIYAKYIGDEAPCSICFDDKIRKNVIDRICTNDGSVDAKCLDDAQKFVYNILENRYFKDFFSSVYYLKHKLDVLSAGKISVHDVLRSQQLLSVFIEYLDTIGERKILEFIIAVEAFCEQSQSSDNEQLMEDALIIYNKYFSMQASEPLEFGTKFRVQIELDICTETGKPDKKCFSSACYLAIRILEKDHIPRFVSSPFFTKYISKMMQAVSNLDLPSSVRGKERGSFSNHSSDSFLSLLSFEKKNRANQLGHSAPSLIIGSSISIDDEETASQADSVFSCGSNRAIHYRRSKFGVPLATIDHLGRYRPLYDNTYNTLGSDNSAKQKIKHKLDKYLNQSTKKEAEVADQVAQLIIADIQDMVSLANSSIRS